MLHSDQDDIISLNSDASEETVSNQDWESDDQVLDLDEKTLSNFKNSLKEDASEGASEDASSDEEGEWGNSKNIYYDADQDVDEEEEEKEEALLIQKKLLSKIQESDLDEEFTDSFENIHSDLPKLKVQSTLDISSVLERLKSTINDLNNHQSFGNQARWMYATVLNYYLYLRRQKSLKFHPITKILLKIQNLLPVLDSIKQNETVEQEMDQQMEDIDQQDQEIDSDYYTEILNRKKIKTQKREQLILDEKNQKKSYNWEMQDRDLIQEDDKRAASWRILTNKGLSPYRKKENRNPRVKKRHKYEKAVKKLSSFRAVAIDKSASGPYGGEKTGIRKNLARSVKF